MSMKQLETFMSRVQSNDNIRDEVQRCGKDNSCFLQQPHWLLWVAFQPLQLWTSAVFSVSSIQRGMILPQLKHLVTTTVSSLTTCVFS
jgi:hypothetical protein